MVGCAHGLLIMLYYDQRVSEISQFLQCPDQLGVVPLMQADARLIKNIENAHQARADLRCKTDPLAFTAGERSCSAGKRQVSKSYADKESKTRPNLLDDSLGNQHFFLAELLLIKKAQCVRHGEIGKLSNAHTADRDGEGRFFQTSTAAVRARDLRHTLFDIFPHGRALRFFIAALEIVYDPLKLSFDYAEAFIFLKAELKLLPFCSIQNRIQTLFGNASDRVCQLEVIPFGKRFKIHF